MKKKGYYEIIIRGKSGIVTTLTRKTWSGAVRSVTKLQFELSAIWSDAYCIAIYSTDEEAQAKCLKIC